jgi:hypothetical protein
MRLLTLAFSGAGQQSFVIDRATNFVGAAITNGTLLVSSNPGLVANDINAAAANSIRNDVIAYATTTGVRPAVSIPLVKGQTVYATASAVGSGLIWLDK